MKNLLYVILITGMVLSCSKDDEPKQAQNSAPIITAQTFIAHENIPDDFIIGTVVATDTDDDALTFSIKTSSNDLFEMTPTGALSLSDGKMLSYATAQTHKIIVSVSDGAIDSNAEVIINVAQNQIPSIADQSFEVAEDFPDTSTIGTIMASDPDGDALVFSITVNDNELFEISGSGELKLMDGHNLDHETATEHVITVGVSDGINSIEAQVTITVTNVIDALAEDPNSFITIWKTETDNETIAIGVNNLYSYDYKIDWGDGTVEEIVHNSNPDHTYTTAGTYTVAIQGDFPAIKMDNEPFHGDKLLGIEQWGDIEWKSMGSAFSGCENMEYHATDVPNLSQVFNFEAMFSFARSFNADLNDWDMSNAVILVGMFREADSFNGSIGTWDTGNVTSMSSMFYGADSFNQDLNNWDVSKVQTMNSMFAHALAFNGNISEWNVGNVINMNSMFYRTLSFNQNIGGWNVGKVREMTSMFQGAEVFNQDLNGWDVGAVTNMSGMFHTAYAFDGDISSWDVRNVTNMSNMFHFAAFFNQDISGWDVSKVQNMIFMFHSAISFNQNIGNWNVGQVDLMSSMFSNAASFNQDIGGWNVSNVIQMYEMFASAISFNQDISGWDVSNVTDLRYMFSYASAFDQNLGAWNIASSGHLYGIFNNSGLTTTNYDNTLIGWAANPETPNNLLLGYNNLTYCNGANARDELINVKGWNIADDGIDPNCN